MLSAKIKIFFSKNIKRLPNTFYFLTLHFLSSDLFTVYSLSRHTSEMTYKLLLNILIWNQYITHVVISSPRIIFIFLSTGFKTVNQLRSSDSIPLLQNKVYLPGNLQNKVGKCQIILSVLKYLRYISVLKKKYSILVILTYPSRLSISKLVNGKNNLSRENELNVLCLTKQLNVKFTLWKRFQQFMIHILCKISIIMKINDRYMKKRW